ncbi:MAG: ATP-binding cassette domain-containing protein [Verrucomicrobia bacterium]|jgi:oligopeptide transport system ATP-binding protein|nr:ATP-binding cassette domain-containing protein [Verrucomicrobiota bacterium]OQC64330.1 MAG: Oligopeptide transport ATP-binding protein OppF [Verrucomicrobia bacterium ADurb.Bin006]NMD21224.1 ATP-binding cassette domain-containing protein [Verrucomicrobiota bacterium]HOF49683.1 ATP-binding cassette domain-containing protein [Verrucomicrobiota bacterium]HOR72721.1 ATP-binding cassette domain-containing protein [Verrucomicrobiota bacterium]
MSLLSVRSLSVRFPVLRSWWRARALFVHAVDDVSFELAAGETVGLVGESGCGKTTLGRAVVRLIEPTAGAIEFGGIDLASLRPGQLRPVRRRLQMIFQDPYGSLNPCLTVEQIIGEALDIHGLARTREALRARVGFLLDHVGLAPADARRYPREFSGGQRQRIGIARALAAEPQLIVCDEPVSALDVSVQAQIVNLLHDLQREHGLAYLFIAHDLALIEHLSRRILVMYLGRVVEAGDTKMICRTPAHPYTQALISAVPRLDPVANRRRIVLTGEVPSPITPPSGCGFHPRCPIAEPRCGREVPALREIASGRWAACHLAWGGNRMATTGGVV